MCGIAGILASQRLLMKEPLIDMANSLHHRGPDDQGVWVDNNIGLAHARLSIHDLSRAGHQPMCSYSGRFVIVFNGEIYNYRTLKSRILEQKHMSFNSDSDTEVLVNAIDLYGIEEALKKCVGMFALAVWDKQESKLYLARDRFGEKPLYYGSLNGEVVFASELKGFHQHYKPFLHIDPDVLTTYMRYGYVPKPYSIYKDIYKLKPGSIAIVGKNGDVSIKKYWSAYEAVYQATPFKGSYTQAVEQLEQKLLNTLSDQKLADVPVGTFLSGGVDSSLITALTQSLTDQQVETFSIGFYDKRFNEAEHARAVAKALGTRHEEMYVDEKDVRAIIPDLPDIYDEPFADSSQLPTYLVSKIAKSKVTACLSGDAGDELFGGYTRYMLAEKVKRKLLDNRFYSGLFKTMPTNLLKLIAKLTPSQSLMLDKLLKLKSVVNHSEGSFENLYLNICSQAHAPQVLVKQGTEKNILDENHLLETGLSFQEWMMYADSQTYMCDDILTKVDRAAMSHSLETRIPFLDHHIYEFAWSLPLEYKIHRGTGKSVLRDVLYKYVPQKLIERPKMGFAVPIASWLRGPLREWAQALLDPEKLERQGLLNTQVVHHYWTEHQKGKRNWHYLLWNVLMFQAWYERWHG